MPLDLPGLSAVHHIDMVLRSLIPAKASISDWHSIPLDKHRFALAQLGIISLAINTLMANFMTAVSILEC